MTRHIRTGVSLLLLTLAALTAGAAPAGAQQLIDATDEGGQAFVAFTIMVVIFAFTLFMLDRVRRKALDEEEKPED